MYANQIDESSMWFVKTLICQNNKEYTQSFRSSLVGYTKTFQAAAALAPKFSKEKWGGVGSGFNGGGTAGKRKSFPVTPPTLSGDSFTYAAWEIYEVSAVSRRRVE